VTTSADLSHPADALVSAADASVSAADAAVSAADASVSAGGASVPAGGVSVSAGGASVPAGGVSVSAGGVSVPAGDASVPAGGLSSSVAVPGTAGLVVLTAVVDETLDLAAHEAAVADPRAGAVVSFQGVVRDHDHGRGVTLLEYEGHPTAAAILREVAEEIAADPDVYAVAVSHRIGTLEIGDVALVAAVSTAHRAAAFAACARLVDEAKARLPIWKRQVFLDGTEEWVNCP
jgi:molybdopterin synthase catalytic subunit